MEPAGSHETKKQPSVPKKPRSCCAGRAAAAGATGASAAGAAASLRTVGGGNELERLAKACEDFGLLRLARQAAAAAARA